MRTISRERRDELRRNKPLCRERRYLEDRNKPLCRERCYYEMRKRQLFECTRGLTLCALELMADPKLLGSKGKKWQQAKAIIDRWTVLFGKKDI